MSLDPNRLILTGENPFIRLSDTDGGAIYADNIAIARWLQTTVQGMLNDELSDTSIPVTDAAFDKTGDARDFWTERAVSHDEEVALTWYDIGEPLLIHCPHATRPSPGTQVWCLHGADPGARGTPDGQWRSGEGPPVSRPARGQTIQHLRPGFLRDLDRGALTPSVVAVETRLPQTGLLPCGRLSIMHSVIGR